MNSELRRQLIHLASGLFAVPVPFLGPRWGVVLAAIAVFTNWVILPMTGIDRALMRDGEKFVNGIRHYPLAVLVALVALPLHLALAAWAILAVGDAFSNLVGRAYGRVKLPWHRKKSWAGTFGFFATAMPAAAAMAAFCQHHAPNQSFLAMHVDSGIAAPMALPTLLLATGAGALVAAIAESLPISLDDNLSVTFGGGLAMALAASAMLP